jgi:hypothetical protein
MNDLCNPCPVCLSPNPTFHRFRSPSVLTLYALHPHNAAASQLFLSPNFSSKTSRTSMMQPAPNRLGLGLRPPMPMPSFSQGPSTSALAQQQHQQFPCQPPKVISLFIGLISGGIDNSFLNELLAVSDFPSSWCF